MRHVIKRPFVFAGVAMGLFAAPLLASPIKAALRLVFPYAISIDGEYV